MDRVGSMFVPSTEQSLQLLQHNQVLPIQHTNSTAMVNTSRNYTVLVTGSTQGLGRALLEQYLKRPNYTVIAANRDIHSSLAKDLLNLPTGNNSRLIQVKIEATNARDPHKAAQELESKHEISHLDLVIANAGVAQIFPTVSDLNVWDLEYHLQVNVYSMVWLWQAVLPLLKQAQTPKFISMSSFAGCIADMGVFPHNNAAYGTSKAAMNFLTCKMHYEEPSITTFPVHPGSVRTGGGNAAMAKLGFGEALISVGESVSGMIKLFDNATKEETSGKFWEYTGKEMRW